MTTQLRPIVNREGAAPESGWVHVIARGDVPIEIPDGKGGSVTIVQQYDDAAIKAILRNFSRDASQPNFAGLLTDFDHFSTDVDKTSEAAAWGMEFREVSDGIECREKFTDTGLKAVMGERFKFASAVHMPQDYEFVGRNRVRPLHVDRLALTNDPNNKRLRPFDINTLMNRASGVPSPDNENDPAKAGEQKGKSEMHKDMLLKLLDLPATATDQEIQTAYDGCGQETMKNRADKITGLTTEKTALMTELVEGDLKIYAPVIKNRVEMKTALLANRTSTLKILSSLATPGIALMNRDGTHQQIEGTEDKDQAQKREDFVNEVQKRNTLKNRADAISLAATLKPELFAQPKPAAS